MRILIAISAAALLLTLPVAGRELADHRVAGDRPAGADLISAVTARAVGSALGGQPRIEVQPRSTGDWGFGSAVRPTFGVAAAPQARLFIAHRLAGRWQVALEGETEFARLSAEAPILAADERRVLGARADDADSTGTGGQGGGGATAYGDRRTGIGLPFAVGTSWQLASGPHPMGVRGPRSAIDLTGGDGVVRAAADGIAYTMCGGRGWIRILHARGFATDYYHLRGNINVAGVPVRTGDFLGHIGNDVSCGGYSTGAHVHFSLMRFGVHVELDRYSLGRWVVSAGPTARTGTLRHGSVVVGVGDPVFNFGPQALNQGVVDTGGRGALPLRSGPGNRYKLVGQVRDGATVNVVCSVRGARHWGRSAYGTTLWNRLADGSYVSDAFLATGTSGPVRGYCP
jgi:LasA protease